MTRGRPCCAPPAGTRRLVASPSLLSRASGLPCLASADCSRAGRAMQGAQDVCPSRHSWDLLPARLPAAVCALLAVLVLGGGGGCAGCGDAWWCRDSRPDLAAWSLLSRSFVMCSVTEQLKLRSSPVPDIGRKLWPQAQQGLRPAALPPPPALPSCQTRLL